ncbi:uncharacterized protein LOC113311997 [Papaver somniferum]|uniref:uncharacterized protein LOC113311997 n=1 Tax=Papaver somniferum TaxID=3469 RepID=UPI000E6FE746|nr:uncharacterized protein LOC113311997 [Papaver somniferum]
MESLLSLGFEAFQADTSLFTLKHGSIIIIILIYIDDILITGSSLSACDQVICQLSNSLLVKDLGPILYFLGLEIMRNDTVMHLSQTKYIVELLKKTNTIDAKPYSSPAIANSKLSKHDGEFLVDASDYRSLVGDLQYATWTRPEIFYAVNQVCQLMSHPTIVHLVDSKRILRYLKGILDYGIVLQKWLTTLSSYYDSDWSGNRDDRRPTSGFCVMCIHYVSTDTLVDDVFTKGLFAARLDFLRDKTRVQPLPQLEGG